MHSKLFFSLIGLLAGVFFFAFLPLAVDATHTTSTVGPTTATVGVPTKFLSVVSSGASDSISCVFWWDGSSLGGMINENTGNPIASTPCVAGDTCTISYTYTPVATGSFRAWASCLAAFPEGTFNTPIPVFVTVTDNPPVISSLLVAGDSPPYQTTDTTPTISFSTDENAWCRMSTTDTNWTSMTSLNDCSGGQGSTFHACTYGPSFAVGPHNLFVSCRDSGFNEQTSGTNADVPFEVIASGVPSAIITLQSQSGFTVDISGASTFGGTPPYTFDWDFGDGITASGVDPGSHTYTTGGTKTITLTVTDSASAVDTASLDVILTAPTFNANFIGAPLSVLVSSPVDFTDTSIPDAGQVIISWFWQFGDGDTSTLQNPSHAYATPGNYTVTLAASQQSPAGGPITTDSESKLNCVNVNGGGASFTVGSVSPTSAQEGVAETFNAQVVVGGIFNVVSCALIVDTAPPVTMVNRSTGLSFSVSPCIAVPPSTCTASASYTFPAGSASNPHSAYVRCVDSASNAGTGIATSITVTGGGAVCGNGTCDAGETAASCPADCGGGGGGGATTVVRFSNPLGAGTFTELINNIINFIFTIAVIVAPILLVIAGVIFMTAAGDPGKVATARRMLLWTIVGFGVILISKGLVAVLEGILGI